MKLSIRNFLFTVTDDDLDALLSQFGAVADAYVIVNRETRLSRGFGFVDMPNAHEAQRAIESLDGYPWHSRTISVNEANPKRAAHQ